MNYKYFISLSFLCIIFITGCQDPQSCQLGSTHKENQEWIEAADEYMECLTLLTDNARKAEITADLNEVKEKIISNVSQKSEQLCADSKVIPDYIKAVDIVKKALKYDKDQQLESLINNYKEEIEGLSQNRDALVEKAQVSLLARKWNDAAGFMQNALDIDPASEQLQKQYRTIISERELYFRNNIEQLCSQREYESAKTLLEQWEFQSPKPDANIFEPSAKLVYSTIETEIRNKITSDISQDKYYSAFQLMSQFPEIKFPDIEAKINSDGIAFYLDQYQNYQKQNSIYYAFLAVAKAKKIAPNSQDIDIIYSKASVFVDESLKIRIGIAPFTSPNDETNVGIEISDSLKSILMKELPYGIDIDADNKPGYDSISDGSMEKVVLLNLDYAVFGDVHTYKVTEDDRVSDKYAIIKLVEDHGINPNYEQFVLKFGENLDKQSYIPEKNKRLIRDEKVPYVKGEKTVRAMINATIKIYFANEDKLIECEPYEAALECSDDYQVGIDGTDIADDPLKLEKTSLDLENEIKDIIVRKMADLVKKQFVSRKEQFLQNIEDCLSSNKKDLAAQYAAQGYLYCLKENVVDEDISFTKIKDYALILLSE